MRNTLGLPKDAKMDASNSTIAEAYRLALEDGVVSTDVVDKWLDTLIGQSEIPSSDVVEASLAVGDGPSALALALRPLARGCDRDIALRGYFALAAQKVDSDLAPVCTVTRRFGRIASASDMPADWREAMMHFSDTVSLSRGNYVCAGDDIVRELRDFLVAEGRWPEAQQAHRAERQKVD
jgi:hypothetical protein